MLTETVGPPGSGTTQGNSGIFVGTVSLSATNSAGVLWVAHDDTVTATYTDADDGQGGFNVVVTDTANVDCVFPTISNVQSSDLGPWAATVNFSTNETANGTVRYGTSCASLTETSDPSGSGTTHSIVLTGLDAETTYFYEVDAEDEAGNVTTADNSGSCYQFTTTISYFTEDFGTDGVDLINVSLTFTPDQSNAFYSVCGESITALPTSTNRALCYYPCGDNTYHQVNISGGNEVSLYGVDYSTLYQGTNGYITFTAGDTDSTPTLADHFDLPRISALFTDLDPTQGGRFCTKQLVDRVSVTWDGVPHKSAARASGCTFQVDMYFDETIVISYMTVNAPGGIAGLSEGDGTPADFGESNLSETDDCP